MKKLQLQKPFISIEITKHTEGYVIQTQKKTIIFYHGSKTYAVEDFPRLEQKIQQLIIQWNIGELKK